MRLADVRPVADLAPHEEYIEPDITDLEAFTAACEGIDTVLHLAADPSPKADFYQSLLSLNIIGGYNGFEAARRAGSQRIVFASSIMPYWVIGVQKPFPGMCPFFRRMSTVPQSVLARPSAESTPTSTACPASVCA